MTATTGVAEALATTSPAVHATASVMAFVLMAAIYLIPTWIAMGRDTKKKAGIISLNVFLGWTGLGWIAALVWAFSERKKIESVEARRTDY